jgi:ketosteroid isomerase-like protein
MISAILTAAAIVCAAPSESDAAAVHEARASFNEAILNENIDGIAAVLAVNVLLVSGTDSLQFSGRNSQLELWREELARDGRLIYDRSPACVTVSQLYPIAMEIGEWRGSRSAGDENFIGGSYSAKWRKEDDRWVIEAEIFITTTCGGALCPEVAEAKP